MTLSPTDPDFQLARDRLAKAYRDMAAADLDQLMELYLPDALIQGPTQPPVRGAAAIRTFWAGLFSAFRVELESTLEEVTVFGDVLVVRGRAVGVLTPANGAPPVRVDSWFHQIYRRQLDGTLRFWRGANGPNP